MTVRRMMTHVMLETKLMLSCNRQHQLWSWKNSWRRRITRSLGHSSICPLIWLTRTPWCTWSNLRLGREEWPTRRRYFARTCLMCFVVWQERVWIVQGCLWPVNSWISTWSLFFGRSPSMRSASSTSQCGVRGGGGIWYAGGTACYKVREVVMRGVVSYCIVFSLLYVSVHCMNCMCRTENDCVHRVCL